MTKFSTRRFNASAAAALTSQGYPPALARALSARGVESSEDLDYSLKALLPPNTLLNNEKAGNLIADAIWDQKKIVIVGDYDCDGATAVSLAILGLQALGAQNVDYIIPDREFDGYGLSPSLVDRAKEKGAELIITVDNGIVAFEAVERANSLGIPVIVTDHHLASETLPNAACIVNPNQPGDSFKSKSLAGVGVMLYVLLATRKALRERGVFRDTQPNLFQLMDLVSLGTVADVVPLDKNNRILVSSGLNKIRNGNMLPGISALLSQAGKNAFNITTSDLSFILAPRINASGRLANISTGVECLSSYDINEANRKAKELENFNRERKSLETAMQAEAILQMGSISVDESNSITLLGENWHSGIIGLIASRVKERTYRPTIAFTTSVEEGTKGQLKGSGRSIPGVHIRDVLADIDKNNPGLIVKFGGHALAAGLTIEEKNFDLFKKKFEETVTRLALPDSFNETLVTDGELSAGEFSVHLAKALKEQVWGAGFPAPIFANNFKVLSQKLLKDQHLKLTLETDGRQLQAIWFKHKTPLPDEARLAYKLDINEWRGTSYVQLIIEAMETQSDDWAA